MEFLSALLAYPVKDFPTRGEFPKWEVRGFREELAPQMLALCDE